MEGAYTGVPTVWVRFWGCNLSCDGFGQVNPLDRSTYALDYQTVDISTIKHVNDLPVFSTGCDSSYSWAKKFSHLAESGTAAEICDRIEAFMTTVHNPHGKFLHPNSGQWTHMAFTGGEPMMNQTGIVDIMEEFDRRGNLPKYVTIETNGTQTIRSSFDDYFVDFPGELFWSISPKLSLSGEKWEDTVLPEVVSGYMHCSDVGQLKYVVDGSAGAWAEVALATAEYRKHDVQWPVWIMPVGADISGQNKVAATVTEGAVDRGYNVAGRMHTYIFGNAIGK